MTREPDLALCVDGRKVICRAADGPVLIGRDPRVPDLTIDHPGISRLHLWLHPGPNWTLVDYESRNGVYLAGRRITGDLVITDGLTVYLADPAGIPITFHYTAPCHCAVQQPTQDVPHTA